MYKLIIRTTCLAVLGYLLFFLLAKSDSTATFRYCPFSISFCSLVVLAIQAANKLFYLQLAFASSASSVACTVFLQLFTHVALTKVQAFTWLEILFSCIVMLLTFFIGFSALFTFIKLAESWLDKP